MKAKRVKKNQNVDNELLSVVRKELWRTIAWGLLIAALLVGVLTVGFKARQQVRPLEYEGRILDRWAGYHHSDEGSFPYFRLVVETDDKHKITVAIDRDDYERAKVGMRIRKTPAGIEMSSDEPAKQQFQNRPGS